MNTPLLSVCIITYNHEHFIRQALDSVLMQKVHFDYGIIVGEDCSTDSTQKVLLEYVKKYPDKFNLLLRKKNIGANKNLVQSFIACNGKYIAYLEGDDYWRDPYKLQKQVDFLENNDDYVITYHNSIVVDENDNLLADEKLKNARDYTAEEMICTDAFILTNTVMFRNMNIKFPPAFDSVLNGDTCLWHLLGEYGGCKYLDDIKPAAYRVHAGGIWSCIDKARATNELVKTRVAIYNNLESESLYRKRLYDAITSTILYALRDAVFYGNLILCGQIFSIMKDHKISAFRVFSLFLSKILKKTKRVFVK